MASADRSRAVRKQAPGSADWGERLVASVLLCALLAALGIRNAVPIDALAPMIATLLFVLAGAAAGVALLWRRHQAGATWFDIAGMLTFVGVAVSVLIEPDQMVRLFTPSDHPD
jgi:protein-S-isoprenylcysteine O-methyltransferase Ste14